MKKLLVIIIMCIGLVGCRSNQDESIKFTEEEIESTTIEQRELTKDIIKEETKLLNYIYDDFDENTFYYSPRITSIMNGKTYMDVGKGIYFYIGEKENHIWLRGVISYSSDNWIFMKNVEIKTGGKIYDIYFDYDDINRQNNSSIYEKYDCDATIQLYDIAKEIVKNKEGKIKFIGDDKTETIDIKRNEIEGLSEMISVYDNLTKVE